MSLSLKGAFRLAISASVVTFVATLIPWNDRVQVIDADVWLTGEIDEPLGAETSTFRIEDGAAVPHSWATPWAEDLRRKGRATFSGAEESATLERGLISVLGSLELGTLLAILGAALGGLLCGITRWWRLLRACGAPSSYGTAARLTLLGLFFNLVLPGLTGGDVIKAAVAAKEHPGRRPAAIMAVGLDRVFGLLVLLWIGALSSLFVGGDLEAIALPLLGVAGLATAGLTILGVPALRRVLGAQKLLALAPQRLSGVIDALREVAGRPKEVLIAMALSLGNHLCVGLGVFAVAHGVGDPAGYFGCLAASAVANSISAVPLAPGGWGVGEAAYAAMFALLGSSESVGYAVSVATRLCMTSISLISGLALWRGGGMSDWSEAHMDEQPETST